MKPVMVAVLLGGFVPLLPQSAKYVCSIVADGGLDALQINGTTIFESSSDTITIGKQFANSDHIYQIAYYNDSTIQDDSNEHLCSYCMIIDCMTGAVVSKFITQSKVISLDWSKVSCVMTWTPDFTKFVLAAPDGTSVPITYAAKDGFFPLQVICPDNMPATVANPTVSLTSAENAQGGRTLKFMLANASPNPIVCLAIGCLSVDGGSVNLNGEFTKLPPDVEPLDDLEDVVQVPTGWDACFNIGENGQYYLYFQNSDGTDCQTNTKTAFTITLPFSPPTGAHFFAIYEDSAETPGYQGLIN